jgi:hypothetical protein
MERFDGESLEKEISARLSALAGPPVPADAAVLSTIRDRATGQRRRHRSLALAVAAVVVSAGIGAVSAINRTQDPPPAPAASFTTLLDWPARGRLAPRVALDKVTQAWDDAVAGSRHEQVRLLYAGPCQEQAIIIVEGRTAGGQARLAVLRSDPKPIDQRTSADPAGFWLLRGDVTFRLGTDVAAPSVEPRMLVTAVGGTRAAGSSSGTARPTIGCTFGLVPPMSPNIWLTTTFGQTEPNRTRIVRSGDHYLAAQFTVPWGPSSQEIVAGRRTVDCFEVTNRSGNSLPNSAKGFHLLNGDNTAARKSSSGGERHIAVLVSDEAF